MRVCDWHIYNELFVVVSGSPESLLRGRTRHKDFYENISISFVGLEPVCSRGLVRMQSCRLACKRHSRGGCVHMGAVGEVWEQNAPHTPGPGDGKGVGLQHSGLNRAVRVRKREEEPVWMSLYRCFFSGRWILKNSKPFKICFPLLATFYLADWYNQNSILTKYLCSWTFSD